LLTALITHPKSKPVTQLVVTCTILKQQLAYSNCGKIGHAKGTCHNMKREELAALLGSTKVIESVVGVTAQHVKLTRVQLRYPCIICSSSKHCAPYYLRITKVHNLFRIKPTSTTTVMAKSSKPDNVPINVIIVVTTRSQVP